MDPPLDSPLTNMRYFCMFEIMTIQMHKPVKDIRYGEPTAIKNSYAAHSVV